MFKDENFKSIIFTVMLTLTLSTLFTGCGEEKSSKDVGSDDTVIIGTMNLVNGDLIAQYEKLYENELGRKVQVVHFNSGKDIISALASNTIDIGEAGTAPAALAISNNLDIKIIFVGDVIGAAETLVVKKDSGIAGIKDLAGKKIATPFASTAHYSLLNALKLEGVSESDVKLLDLKPDDILSAWQRGDIDGAYIWHPVLDRLLEDGKTLTDSAKLAEKGIVTADLIVARTICRNSNESKRRDFKRTRKSRERNCVSLGSQRKRCRRTNKTVQISQNRRTNKNSRRVNGENSEKHGRFFG